MPRVNFKATEMDNTPFPNGPHLFEAESAELTKAKSSQNMMIKVTSRCIEPGSEFDGRKDWEQFVLVPQSGWKLKEFCEAADVPHTATPGTGKGEFDIELDTDHIVGRRYIAHKKQETYTKMDAANQPVIDPTTGKPESGIRSTTTKFEKAPTA